MNEIRSFKRKVSSIKARVINDVIIIGVQLPESLKRPHLTSEALHTSNTFSDNETDIVLSNERVTDQGFIALAPFPTWAPLDSPEVLRKSPIMAQHSP